MSPSEDDMEDLKNKVDGIEDLDYKVDDLESSIDDINFDIENIKYDIEELRFSKEDYEIYLYPTTIQRYLDKLIKLQQRESKLFFPSSEPRIRKYFTNNFDPFDYQKIKYNLETDFSLVSKIISYQGSSGSSFIETSENVIEINKPLLLFYGIEQIAAYYSNLHFNFTWINNNFNSLRNDFSKHGIDAFHFKNIVNLENPIDDLLNKKIKLEKGGLAQRFFLVIAPEFLPFFTNKIEISLVDLLKLFYLSSSLPNKTKRIFKELYGSEVSLPESMIDYFHQHRQPLVLYLIYLLSFLFCHMCRYKLYAWTMLLNSDEKNIGYFIKFFLKYSKKYFIMKVFDKVNENKQKIKRLLTPGALDF